MTEFDPRSEQEISAELRQERMRMLTPPGFVDGLLAEERQDSQSLPQPTSSALAEAPTDGFAIDFLG